MSTVVNISSNSSCDNLAHTIKHLDFESTNVLNKKNNSGPKRRWKGQYNTLNIYEKYHEFVITNEQNENSICLSPNDFKEFQNYYADKVHTLNIKNVVLYLENYGGHDDVIHGRMIRKGVLNISRFKNLKSLTYRYMGLPRHHLKELAEINENVEELCLVNCSMEIGMDELLQDVVIKMKNLKALCIENFQRFTVKYFRFQEILSMKKLENLQLSAVIMPDEQVPESSASSLAIPPNLKELNIQLTVDPTKWPDNLHEYFKNFATLSSITIETIENLNDNTLAIIAYSCKNLEFFHIQSTDFENIERFPIADTVKTLTISWCRGLTCENLRHLLTQLKIATFHSIETTYCGTFEGSRVSRHIQSLRVDGINTRHLKFPYRNNNLQELTWYDPHNYGEQFEDHNSLAWCSSLRVLDIQSGYIPLDTLMKLNCLQCLYMPQPLTPFNWSYITDLMRHTTLRELSLRDCFSNGYRKYYFDVPTEGVPTNISDLNVPLEAFESALDFWLDLWDKNSQLTRICCTYNPHDKLDTLLASLIYHGKFPKSLRNIVINGFTIDCHELRSDFGNSLLKLQNGIDNIKCWHDSEMYRIILRN